MANGVELGDECEAYHQLYNLLRPHESLDLYPPIDTFLATPISFEHERDLIASARAEAAAASAGQQGEEV